MLTFPRPGARVALAGGGRCQIRLRRGDRGPFGFDLGAAGFKLAGDVGEAAALGQAAGGAGRRMRRGGIAVPAPQVALARNQPLAGLEHRGEPRAVGLLDHADLREPTCQFGGPLDMAAERNGSLRENRIARVEVGADPAHR